MQSSQSDVDVAPQGLVAYELRTQVTYSSNMQNTAVELDQDNYGKKSI